MKIDRWKLTIAVISLTLTCMLTGCSGISVTQTGAQAGELSDAQKINLEQASVTLPPVDPTAVQGSIEIGGSSTVYLLSAGVAEAFRDDGSQSQIAVTSSGTTAGFQRFCTTGDLDIVDASREMRASEIATCVERGQYPIGFRVGTDALVLVVSKTNTFVDALSFAQLAQIFSGRATTWADIDPRYPREPIALYSPGPNSGTYDYFVETILGNDSTRMTSQVIQSEDDEELADGVEANPYAIGYFGFAYSQEHQDTLRVIPIDNGNSAMRPTLETVEDGSYPLARRCIFTVG
ncbi:MAG: protein sphX [Blastochloris sp.]|nr:protein sphX [Blastochloris sp.]